MPQYQYTNIGGVAVAGNPIPLTEVVSQENLDISSQASATNLSLKSGSVASIATPPGMWSSAHTPSTTVQAAAGIMSPVLPTTRNVCTTLSFTLAGGASAIAAAAPLIVVLRDGYSSLAAPAAPTCAAPSASGNLPVGANLFRMTGTTAAGVETISPANLTVTTTTNNQMAAVVIPAATGIYVTYNLYWQFTGDTSWSKLTGLAGQTVNIGTTYPYVANGGFLPATAASPILWSSYMNVPAAAAQAGYIVLSDICIVGSAGMPMTAEFTTVVGANGYESVAITGFLAL
jgi:hypothetical protein